MPELHRREFDAVVFLLSIQNMDPLHSVLKSASWMLRSGGRTVLLMTHPCFRLPRQSGWGVERSISSHPEEIEAKIEAFEEEKLRLERALSDTYRNRDYKRGEKLSQQLRKLESQIEALYEAL